MDRYLMKQCHAMLGEIEQALEHAPYRIAAQAIRNVEALRETVCLDLPGGFLGYCEACDGVIGCDEAYVSDSEGDVRICEACAPDYHAAPADEDGGARSDG